jgi:hypothetical protein
VVRVRLQERFRVGPLEEPLESDQGPALESDPALELGLEQGLAPELDQALEPGPGQVQERD